MKSLEGASSRISDLSMAGDAETRDRISMAIFARSRGAHNTESQTDERWARNALKGVGSHDSYHTKFSFLEE
jgi:hypothetical protein